MCRQYKLDLYLDYDEDYTKLANKLRVDINKVFTNLNEKFEAKIVALTPKSGHVPKGAASIDAIRQAARSKLQAAEAAKRAVLEELFAKELSESTLRTVVNRFGPFCDDFQMTMFSFVGEAESELNHPAKVYFNLEKITADDTLIKPYLAGEYGLRIRPGADLNILLGMFREIGSNAIRLLEHHDEDINKSIEHINSLYTKHRQPRPALQSSPITGPLKVRQNVLRIAAKKLSELTFKELDSCKDGKKLPSVEQEDYDECLYPIMASVKRVQNLAERFNEAIFAAKYDISTFHSQ